MGKLPSVTIFVQEGGLPTATTYLKKHKFSKGEAIAQSRKERLCLLYLKNATE